MSETRLQEMLAELVADVNSPSMGRETWRAGRRLRRHRLVGGTALAAVLVAAAAAASTSGFLRGAGEGRNTASVGPGASPSAAGTSSVRMRTGPARSAVADLPSDPSRFGALSQLPTSAEALSGRTAPHVVAAAQRAEGPVLVLGTDGRWRDAGTGASLLSTSISPDARRLALVNGAGLLLVDVTTGSRRTWPVPDAVGRVDFLVWLANGSEIAVEGDGGSGVVSAADGTFRRTGIRPEDLVATERGRSAQLPWSDLVVPQTAATVPGSLSGARQWYGAGWLRGGLAARTGFAGPDQEQAVLIVDAAATHVTNLLTLPSGAPPAVRSNGCCETLGWLDGNTVILRDGGYVLAWQFRSGALSRIATLPGTVARGADPGYNTAVALAQ